MLNRNLGWSRYSQTIWVSLNPPEQGNKALYPHILRVLDCLSNILRLNNIQDTVLNLFFWFTHANTNLLFLC
jgi:hypothetical protein